LFLFALLFFIPLPHVGAQTPQETPPSENWEEWNDEPEAADQAEAEAEKEKEKQRFYLSLNTDILFFIEDSSLESDPMPILPSFSARFGFPVAAVKGVAIFVAPALGFYSTYYRWSELLDKPVPAAIENREASIIGFVLGVGAEARWALSPSWVLRANLGLSADFRLILLADGLNEGVDPIDDIKKRNEKLSNYFWAGARWIFAHIIIGFDWKPWENYAVGLDFTMQMPFNPPTVNSGDSASIGWRFGIGARFTRLF
jgi:hypothetical protein